MTDREILTKAIDKAIAGGWKPLLGMDMSVVTFEFNELLTRVIWRYKRVTAIEEGSVYGIIFNHDFAKALWGETEVHHFDFVDLDNGGKTEIVNKLRWQYHLQQMVVADDPIKYLGENLPNSV